MRPAGPLFALLSLTGLLTQCQEKPLDFYRDPMRGSDVWRLPIVAPYELITSIKKGGDRWNFQDAAFPDTFSPDSLNFSGGRYLTFHDYSQASYGYCDLQRKQLVRLGGFAQFTDSARRRHFSTQLFYADSVYRGWHATGQLPWAREILAARPYGLVASPHF